jgi:hypothetical protein
MLSCVRGWGWLMPLLSSLPSNPSVASTAGTSSTLRLAQRHDAARRNRIILRLLYESTPVARELRSRSRGLVHR